MTSKGKVTNKGKEVRTREGFEQGRDMILDKLFNQGADLNGPPQMLLNAAAKLLRFYPLFIRASLLIQRFVQ